jgi:L-ascorbate metabolism protein UlaG (beta-lactamase superfamily)
MKNPTAPLPLSIEKIINVDAIFITHTHFDHFDDEAKKVIPKQIPIFCQPKDLSKIQKAGFLFVTPIDTNYIWEGINIKRITGKHGSGLSGFLMGSVSGFIFEDSEGKRLYIAGDTIYNNCVKETINESMPDFIVINSGEAKMTIGKPITMTKEEVLIIAKESVDSKIIVVHLEAVNHCTLTRKELNEYLKQNGISENVIVPNDSEIMNLKNIY